MKLVVILLLASIACISASPVVKATRKHYKVHAVEKSVKVEEDVVVDLEKNQVIYHTPKHNNIDEATVIHDFKANITLFVAHESKVCYLAELMTYLSQDPKTTEAAFDTVNPDTNEVARIETAEMRIVSEPIIDRTFLSDDLAEKCLKYPMYRIELMHEEMTVEKERQVENLDHTQSRVRRDSPGWTLVVGDKCPLPCVSSRCTVQNKHGQFVVQCSLSTSKYGELIPDCTKQQQVHHLTQINVCTPCCNQQCISQKYSYYPNLPRPVSSYQNC